MPRRSAALRLRLPEASPLVPTPGLLASSRDGWRDNPALSPLPIHHLSLELAAHAPLARSYVAGRSRPSGAIDNVEEAGYGR